MELFDRLQHPDELINRIQDRLKTAINAILRKPIVDGVLISATVNPTATAVEHKLGRLPRGFIVVSGQASIINPIGVTDDKFIRVYSAGSAETVTFWVF
jgi:hypothetical protein